MTEAWCPVYKQKADIPVNLSDKYKTIKFESHQDLEEDYEQLVTGHEVTVKNSQVKPTAQTAKHFDEHLLIVTRLLHTRRLKSNKNTNSMMVICRK